MKNRKSSDDLKIFIEALTELANQSSKKHTRTVKKEKTPPVTENGAIGVKLDKMSLVEFNFSLPSYRTDVERALDKFSEVLEEESKETIARYLFYLRDARAGIGERNTFRFAFTEFLNTIPPQNEKVIYELLKLVPYYGRYDDLLAIYFLSDTNSVIEALTLKILSDQLELDTRNAIDGKPISLLAKWMPSVQTKNFYKRHFIRVFIKYNNLSISEYRKILSGLRRYLEVTEVKMSNNEWEEINYENVPSKANLIYRDAFMRHDTDRRRAYLLQVQNNKAKMNASVLFPCEIVNKYNLYISTPDKALELLWKNLDKDFKINNTSNENKILTVLDTSGSMYCTVDGNLSAKNVANSIAIYAAEHLHGAFKDKAVLFSSNPRFIDFSKDKTLLDKLKRIYSYNDCSNTNIVKVFQLILNTAIKNNLKQSEIPQTLLIISDMEFDAATTHDFHNETNKALFETIEMEFRRNGYMLPKLVFWNVNSRTNTVPIGKNYLGVTLISGFSKNLFKQVLSNDLDPYICLINSISDERYNPVSKALSAK